MKHFGLIALLLCCSGLLFAQEKFKFGNCPVEYLKMTTYEPEPDAPAVVLYENSEVYYRISAEPNYNLFDIITEYVIRIKILTQDGVDFANRSLSYHERKTRVYSEHITDLTGWTYNLEGDKVKKEKLSTNMGSGRGTIA